jgi:anti-sigma factor RsiW
MKCDDAEREIFEQLFGEPDPAAGIRLDAHLRECPRCQREERRWLELQRGLREPGAPPSPALRARLRGALVPERPARSGGLLLRPVPAYVVIAGLVVGAALALAGDRAGLAIPLPGVGATPALAPLAPESERLFTSASCYTTAGRPGARSTVLLDSAGARSGGDSL